MNWSDPLFITSGITGASLVLIGLIVRRFPPKEMNDLYGYRTKRSKASQEAWDFAQEYSNDLLIWIGIYNILIGSIGLFISVPEFGGMVLSMIFIGISLGYLFWKTEAELKKRFGG
ncbi:MAG: SdpI family protein [Cyclobacteriaceae bacterium]